MQRAPVTVSPQQVDALRAVADEVLAQPADVIAWTRDWWAASMVAETGPAGDAARGRRARVDGRAGAGRNAHRAATIPVTASAGRSNVTARRCPCAAASCSMCAG